jgi:hypothetical protein
VSLDGSVYEVLAAAMAATWLYVLWRGRRR